MFDEGNSNATSKVDTIKIKSTSKIGSFLIANLVEGSKFVVKKNFGF